MTDTINIPRAELQAALDALQECRQKIAYLLGNIEWYESAQAIDFADISIKAISARLAVDVCAEKQPDVEKTSQRVEKTAQQGEKPEPVAWMYTGIKNDGITHGPHLCWKPEHMDAMSASKGAVAAPLYTFPPKLEHRVEPVAYVPVHPRNGPLWSMTTDAPSPERLPSYPMMSLYTIPPHRPWVGLTDEEIRNEANHHVFDESFFNGAVWARGKIKEKNNG